MRRIVKITVPGSIYRFYQEAARNIAGSSPEDIMSDALGCYAGMLSKDIAKEREKEFSKLEKDKK